MLRSKYDDVFQGLGCLPGQHSIKIQDNATPVVNACRKIPFRLRDILKSELERMEALDVITKIEEPTECHCN